MSSGNIEKKNYPLSTVTVIEFSNETPMYSKGKSFQSSSQKFRYRSHNIIILIYPLNYWRHYRQTSITTKLESKTDKIKSGRLIKDGWWTESYGVTPIALSSVVFEYYYSEHYYSSK